MLQGCKAVFFDAGGTLFHPYPSVGQIYSETAGRFGCKAEPLELDKHFRAAWLTRDGLAHLKSELDEKIEKAWWKDLVHEVFSQVGGVGPFDEFFEELYDVFGSPHAWQLYPEVPEVLEKIKASGLKLGIVSNWDSRLFKLVKGLDIEKYFDFMLASAVFGASKPSPKIFEEALRRAGVRPQEAIHIGDSLEDDIRGAQGVGIRAVLIDRHPQGRPTSHSPVITTLSRLLT